MDAALARMRETGKPLRRWPGGWWGTVGSPERRALVGDMVAPVPDFPTGTVRALEGRGLIRRQNVRSQWWQDDFILTEAAR